MPGSRRLFAPTRQPACAIQKGADYLANKLSGSGATGARAKRAAIVKQVMKEKGLKMIEASKYVKTHGLY